MTMRVSTVEGVTHRVEGDITTLAVRAGASPAVAVGTSDGTCWWLEPASPTPLWATTDVDVPTGIAVHPRRDEVTLTGPRGYAIWRLGSEPDQHLDPGWSSAAAYAPSGDLAVAAGRTVAIHPHASPTLAALYVSGSAPSTITDVAWTPQGNRVAASAYGGVYMYDGKAPKPVRTYPYQGSHLAVAVNPNRRWVCSGNQDASVHIWRASNGDELQMSGFPLKVTRLAFDDTGRWMANNGAPDVAVWDFSGQGPGGRAAQLLAGHDCVIDLDWRPGPGAVLATVGTEGNVQIWAMTSTMIGQRRLPVRTLEFEDALTVRWLGTDRLVVARAGGAVTIIDGTH